MTDDSKLKPQLYAGLFMVTLSTLMYEILLTRIFSVTMWYHFAFMAISVAMFGMTVGALIVYLLPKYFTDEKVHDHLALTSILFSVSIVFSFLTHLNIPFIGFGLNSVPALKTVGGIYSIALFYSVIAIPFVFSGMNVCLALTKFPRYISKLYAADLAGAAIGCLMLGIALKISDGPTAVILIGALAATGGIFYSYNAGTRKAKRFAIIIFISFSAFTAINSGLAAKQKSLLRLIWVKGVLEVPPIYENWNSFSRINVNVNSLARSKPLGWGMSPTCPPNLRVRELDLIIDATAATPMTNFEGDLESLTHLKYDITNLAHYIREDSDVLIVGSGGGRDILSALAFKQKSMVAVDINGEITKAVNGEFGDFTGHLDRYPQVDFVVDEARSYLSRSDKKYDIIQVSLIDTWAATASGAFVLTENTLYTIEAWQIFLEHLNPGGVLSFSRWYYEEQPGEMYRLATLANTALTMKGVKEPKQHILIARNFPVTLIETGVGTMLISTDPFTDDDVKNFHEVCDSLQFEVILSPLQTKNATFEWLISGEESDQFVANFPLNITPPTDNKPFFFNMLKFKDIFNKNTWNQGGTLKQNTIAVTVLGLLLVVVIILTACCIILPLALTSKKIISLQTLPLFLFFGSIGLGFIFIEIAQMQRLNIFLGHPTYGLSVVLFTLLLSSSLGSYLTGKIRYANTIKAGKFTLLLLVAVLVVFSLITQPVISSFQGLHTPGRILIAVLLLFPIGIFMGTAFPFGMKIAAGNAQELTPWFWGINGAMSVLASVLAIMIALYSSISTTFYVGIICYCIAFVSFYIYKK
ncbi:MAG: hypothetical protein P9L92_13070 [Candidatus Electryonea clarkiae]|nr:hypothetical protein [Candidatus Electryonea clarkiae]MDP8286445.1 hypothetical protein [Candidatus Electryonea clarkiae]